jgi:hypothetical protein
VKAGAGGPFLFTSAAGAVVRGHGELGNEVHTAVHPTWLSAGAKNTSTVNSSVIS